MPVKIYRMRSPRWPAAARRFACREAGAPYPGAVSLTVLGDVAAPVAVKTAQGPLVIVAEGFHWIQLAPRKERWWLTAMFDAQKRLVQFYFDVTFENRILPHGGSWCRDAYLDVVLDRDGTARILDEEELAAAFAAGEITRGMYEQARRDAAAVVSQFAGRAGALETLCRGYLDALLPCLAPESARQDAKTK